MKELKIALIGCGFMGKTHSIAYSNVPMYFFPSSVTPVKEVVTNVTESLAKKAAEQYGFNKWTTRWEDVIADKSIDIIDIVAPNDLHKPIAIAAAEAGKHIFCEKPLARNSPEALEIYKAVENTEIKHMMGFSYRKVPAVAFAKQLIEMGKLGEIKHFHGFYLSDWALDPNVPISWRFQESKSGVGVTGDQGSHIIDMARYLLGDFKRVIAQTETVVNERPVPSSEFDTFDDSVKSSSGKKAKVDLDDKCEMLIEFENGIKGSLEVSRCACGHRNSLGFEVNGVKGSLFFNWEKNNELQYYSTDESFSTQGFRTIQIGPNHPYGKVFWPIAGINIGFMETFLIEFYEFFSGIINGEQVSPNFYDGLMISKIVDAAIKSSASGTWEKC